MHGFIGEPVAKQIGVNARPHLCPLPQERISPWRIFGSFVHRSDQSSRLICKIGGNRFSFSSGEVLSRLGNGERNSAEPKARRAERAGASESTPG